MPLPSTHVASRAAWVGLVITWRMAMSVDPMISLIVVGAGGHAVSCIDLLEQTNGVKIVGVVGQQTEVGTTVCGYPVLGVDARLTELRALASGALVAVGQIRSPDLRIELYRQLVALDYELPVIVAPAAYRSRHANINVGTVVMPGAIVNAGVEVGVNCIINSRALLEHGVAVGDHCHISTAAVVNGDAVIGEGTFVGSGAVVREGVRIGRRCVIGMGALVRHDLPDGSVFYGTSQHGA